MINKSGAQLKESTSFIYKHWATILAIVYPILILLDTYSLPSSERIYQGQPFYYDWYMDYIARSRFLIVVGICLFFVLIARVFIFKFGRYSFLPPAIFFSLSLLIFVVWSSMPAIGAIHLATTPILNQSKYNLYRQTSSGQFRREAVLVKCDSLGLLCNFVQKWESETTILSEQPDPHLSIDATNNTLLVSINGKIVYTYPLQ